MTSKISWLRHNSLLCVFFSLGVVAYQTMPTIGQTVIRNTAGAGANGLPNQRSNEVRITASQAALEIIKTGDRAAAEPGDTVIYRLTIRNTGQAPARNITITDRLPLGLRFISKSLKGSVGNSSVSLTASAVNNRAVTISLNSATELPPQGVLNVAYAVEVTPDAVRGSGRNLAQAQAGNLTSNQASHVLRIRPGILSDCGTIIGRVFVDKNFDGEQQPNEPGVPNAVIYMDDGNRIVTDANGLFSLANVISGYRSATLDLTSLPGYGLAPNNYFIERNSQSRMVKLAPSSLARVNFGVTPAFSGGKR
ncbi:hypothetical protein NIES22_24850 [Calothrix brevissima NIES-22]|nr:hypothetical protein NIES22_24850 [Calothrix brevissima NIES-22]